ncbi:hypothetical protein [Hoeflea sp.]|uniref:hypothetical protein n=1 Tax=Hoeflea sp. TaxID=1940281 RepID=UPI0037492CA9
MTHRTIRAFAVAVFVLAFGAGAFAEQLDPDRSTFDPDKQFVITPFGAIIGDPAQLTDLTTGRTGYSYCSTFADKDRGLILMASVVLPQQDGAEGGGHGMMMTEQQARDFIAFLRKAPEWADVAAQNKVGLFSKPIGDVIGVEGDPEHLAVKFVSDAESRGSIRIEHMLGGVPNAFELAVNPALKFAAQAEHVLETALAQTPDAAPSEDAEKSKLFE